MLFDGLWGVQFCHGDQAVHTFWEILVRARRVVLFGRTHRAVIQPLAYCVDGHWIGLF